MVSWPRRVPGRLTLGWGRKPWRWGTHLGRAAQARGGEGGRRSRHVAISYFLQLSLTQGSGRGSERPRKTFFQVAFGVAKLFVAGLRWLPAVGSQSVGRCVFSGHGPRGGSLSACRGDGAAARAPLVAPAGARTARTLTRAPGGCAPSVPARPSQPRAPARAAALSRPARPRPPARRRGARGPHKGRRGRQVGEHLAEGGRQGAKVTPARRQLRRPGLCVERVRRVFALRGAK